MKQIPLSNGGFALIDDSDFELLNRWKWKRHTQGYASRTVTGGKNLLMHRQIMGDPVGDVDHLNRNKLDNQRANLRVVSRSINMHNRPAQCNSGSGIKGVSWDKFRNKWRAAIQINGKYKAIGRFDRIEDAIAAYGAAAVSVCPPVAQAIVKANVVDQGVLDDVREAVPA